MIRTKVCYKQMQPPLVDEPASPLTGFVCKEAHVTFGGSVGIRSTELPYPQVSGRDVSEGLVL